MYDMLCAAVGIAAGESSAEARPEPVTASIRQGASCLQQKLTAWGEVIQAAVMQVSVAGFDPPLTLSGQPSKIPALLLAKHHL
jgi:hypothetical protein